MKAAVYRQSGLTFSTQNKHGSAHLAINNALVINARFRPHLACEANKNVHIILWARRTGSGGEGDERAGGREEDRRMQFRGRKCALEKLGKRGED